MIRGIPREKFSIDHHGDLEIAIRSINFSRKRRIKGREINKEIDKTHKVKKKRGNQIRRIITLIDGRKILEISRTTKIKVEMKKLLNAWS